MLLFFVIVVFFGYRLGVCVGWCDGSWNLGLGWMLCVWFLGSGCRMFVYCWWRCWCWCIGRMCFVVWFWYGSLVCVVLVVGSCGVGGMCCGVVWRLLLIFCWSRWVWCVGWCLMCWCIGFVLVFLDLVWWMVVLLVSLVVIWLCWSIWRSCWVWMCCCLFVVCWVYLGYRLGCGRFCLLLGGYYVCVGFLIVLLVWWWKVWCWLGWLVRWLVCWCCWYFSVVLLVMGLVGRWFLVWLVLVVYCFLLGVGSGGCMDSWGWLVVSGGWDWLVGCWLVVVYWIFLGWLGCV